MDASTLIAMLPTEWGAKKAVLPKIKKLLIPGLRIQLSQSDCPGLNVTFCPCTFDNSDCFEQTKYELTLFIAKSYLRDVGFELSVASLLQWICQP